MIMNCWRNCLTTSMCNLLIMSVVRGVVLILYFSDLKFVAAQGGPGIVIAHPGQDVELLCTVTVTDSGSQTAAWLLNNSMGPYRVNAIRGGTLAGYTATFGSHNLIVQDIMMNDDRNGSDYRCVIVPSTGTPSLGNIIEESDPTILYVAGIPAIVPNVIFDNITFTLSWGEPFNNLDPIVNYTVSCSGDVTCPPNFTTTDSTTRSYTITNLTPMTNYTFSVVAINCIGSGEAGVAMIIILTTGNTTSSLAMNMTTTSSMSVTNNTSIMDMTTTLSNTSSAGISTATSSIEITATTLSIGITTTSSRTSSVGMTAIESSVDMTTTSSDVSSMRMTTATLISSVEMTTTASLDMTTTTSDVSSVHTTTATSISSVEMTATTSSMDMATTLSDVSSVRTTTATLISSMEMTATTSSMDMITTSSTISSGNMTATATSSIEMTNTTTTPSIEMITSTTSVDVAATTTITSSVESTITTTSSMDRTTARSGMDDCDCNNNAILIGVVAGVDCVVIIIVVITNIIFWIYCFRKKHHTGTFSDLQIHSLTEDTISPAYYSVANPNFKDSELAEDPNSYYEEVNKPQEEIKMNLNPAYAVP